MKLHRNCITDPLVKAWALEHRRLDSDRPLAEYIAARWQAISPSTVTVIMTEADPWITAACGHRHQLGLSCSTLAAET